MGVRVPCVGPVTRLAVTPLGVSLARMPLGEPPTVAVRVASSLTLYESALATGAMSERKATRWAIHGPVVVDVLLPVAPPAGNERSATVMSGPLPPP